jgi:hypothetical protein
MQDDDEDDDDEDEDENDNLSDLDLEEEEVEDVCCEQLFIACYQHVFHHDALQGGDYLVDYYENDDDTFEPQQADVEETF